MINPFKPHIYKSGKYYKIRVWRFGYNYLDEESRTFFWSEISPYAYASLYKNRAIEMLESLKNK